MRYFGIGISALFLMYVVLATAPALRETMSLAGIPEYVRNHQQGIGYASFVAEILLVMLFGGIVFSEAWKSVIQDEVERFERENADATRLVATEMTNETKRLVELSRKKSKSFKDWEELLNCAFKINEIRSNTFNQVRITIWLLGKIFPGGVYIALAMILFLAKTAADAALLAYGA